VSKELEFLLIASSHGKWAEISLRTTNLSIRNGIKGKEFEFEVISSIEQNHSTKEMTKSSIEITTKEPKKSRSSRGQPLKLS